MAKLVFKNAMGNIKVDIMRSMILPGSLYHEHPCASVVRLQSDDARYDVLLSASDITRLLPYLTIGELPDEATGEEIRAFVKVAHMMMKDRG